MTRLELPRSTRARHARWSVLPLLLAVTVAVSACGAHAGCADHGRWYQHGQSSRSRLPELRRQLPCDGTRASSRSAYVVNLANAPSFTLAEVARRWAALESASGLDFGVRRHQLSERPVEPSGA